VRRALLVEEFIRLVEAARDSQQIVCGLNGVQRAMLYVVAAYTGCRASELASLTPESFDMQGESVSLGAISTKNGKDAELPLHQGLIEQLNRWMKGVPIESPLWPGKWAVNRHAATMLQADLKAAQIPYVDRRRETFDFHALRGQFVTELDRAGVSLVKAQRLARHSSPNLTANLYTRLRIDDLKPEVDKLPTPPMVIPDPDGFALRLALTTARGVQPSTSEVSDDNRDAPDEQEESPGRKSFDHKQEDAACHRLAGGVIEVPKVGLEPTPPLQGPDFESGASAIPPLRLNAAVRLDSRCGLGFTAFRVPSLDRVTF
jgi:Phage integrase family